MAITSMDELLAGFKPANYIEKYGAAMEAAGILHSLFYTPGIPGAAVAPSSSIDGDALTSYPGQIPYTNPGAGNAYLGRASMQATIQGRLLLCDRLWHNASINEALTTGQSITTPTWPARDANGDTDGEGVMVGIEVSTATTNGSAITNTALTYTNSAGTGSRTGTIPSFPATGLPGTFVPFTLAAGDIGVRSIESLALGTSYAPSGTPVIHLVAYRVLADLAITSNNAAALQDAIRLGLPRTYDNTVPFLLLQASSTTANTIRASITPVHG